MTHFLKNIAVLATVGLCSIGCSHEEPLAEKDPTSSNENKISSMVRSFYDRIHSETRSDQPSYRIKSIDTQVYTVPDSLLSDKTRSITNDSYSIHTITLDFGSHEGFTILSDSPGVDHVFYYTESGCIADTANNVALKDMVECAPLVALNILAGGIPTESSTRGDIDIDPLVPFQWHQGHPFNYYATYCHCASCSDDLLKQHRPLGCVNVAVGQIIATVKKFTGTFYGNRDIDFDKLITDEDYSNDSELIAISHFLSEIALNCQTRFRCDKSDASLEAAAKYLRDLGYLVDHKIQPLDKQRFIKYISLGVPHITAGKNAFGVCHAWILDGVKVYNGSYQYHHNWGQGVNSCDGWSSEYYYGTLQISGNTEYMFNQFIHNTEHLYITLPNDIN